MKIIGLTGGIAAGKSTAAMFLQSLGAKVIDADKVGHRVYDPSAHAFMQVVTTFGEDVVGSDNQIDRRVLGAKVFGNPSELKKLTDIVWPEIGRLVRLEIAGFEAAYPDGVVVLDAAVLFEAGWHDIGDETWVVIVDPEVAIERAMARDALDRKAVEGRMNAQLSNAERRKLADIVIENDSTEAALQEKIEQHWVRFTASLS